MYTLHAVIIKVLIIFFIIVTFKRPKIIQRGTIPLKMSGLPYHLTKDDQRRIQSPVNSLSANLKMAKHTQKFE